jgi:hypothetical protein
MKTLKQLIEEARNIAESPQEDKITRNAFIYLDPRGDNFAQCDTCYLFMREQKRCVLFGPDDEVVAGGSCNLYAKGMPPANQKTISSVTPEQAGYVVAQVRCENCSWFDEDSVTCGLYKLLNKTNKNVFNLDPEVAAKGCCNAWQA